MSFTNERVNRIANELIKASSDDDDRSYLKGYFEVLVKGLKHNNGLISFTFKGDWNKDFTEVTVHAPLNLTLVNDAAMLKNLSSFIDKANQAYSRAIQKIKEWGNKFGVVVKNPTGNIL